MNNNFTPQIVVIEVDDRIPSELSGAYVSGVVQRYLSSLGLANYNQKSPRIEYISKKIFVLHFEGHLNAEQDKEVQRILSEA